MNNATPEFARQTDEPLYPKVLYNRPLTRSGGGRLLLAGGHSGEFSLPTAIYQFAIAAGAGEVIVALPDVLAKFLGGAPGTAFVNSSSSGSLGREALGRLLELSEDADCMLLGASLSNNSNTAMHVERLVGVLERPAVLFDEALVALRQHPALITSNPQTLVIATMAEIFKLAGSLKVAITIRPGGGLINKLEIIQAVAAASQCSYAVYGSEIVIATDGNLSVTPINYRLSLQPALLYGTLTTFWVQNRTNPLAGLTTGAYLIRQVGQNLGDNQKPSASSLATSLADIMRSTDDSF